MFNISSRISPTNLFFRKDHRGAMGTIPVDVSILFFVARAAQTIADLVAIVVAVGDTGDTKNDMSIVQHNTAVTPVR